MCIFVDLTQADKGRNSLCHDYFLAPYSLANYSALFSVINAAIQSKSSKSIKYNSNVTHWPASKSQPFGYPAVGAISRGTLVHIRVVAAEGRAKGGNCPQGRRQNIIMKGASGRGPIQRRWDSTALINHEYAN